MALKKGIGMSMDGEGLITRLTRTGERVEKHSLDVMRRYGDKVHRLAQLNVPVEDFHVEDSILIEEKRSGRNRRTEITVGVDSDKLRALSGIEYDYSIWLHEATYNLGPLSEYKDTISRGEDPRASVGNKYLERAMNSVEDDALRELRSAIKKALKR